LPPKQGKKPSRGSVVCPLCHKKGHKTKMSKKCDYYDGGGKKNRCF